jgi:hypothetical protein
MLEILGMWAVYVFGALLVAGAGWLLQRKDRKK